MMETEMISETLDFYSELTKLIAPEDFTTFSCHECFKSYSGSGYMEPDYKYLHLYRLFSSSNESNVTGKRQVHQVSHLSFSSLSSNSCIHNIQNGYSTREGSVLLLI
jgi:hypothetical protein